jgi:hypothetical protein
MATDAQRYWLSSKKMTVFVEVDDYGRIVDASPIVKKFIGQGIDSLKAWLSRQGGLVCKKLN